MGKLRPLVHRHAPETHYFKHISHFALNASGRYIETAIGCFAECLRTFVVIFFMSISYEDGRFGRYSQLYFSANAILEGHIL